MVMKQFLFILLVLVAREPASATVLDGKSYHLRSGTGAEWEEFADKTPHGSRLDLKFRAKQSRAEQTLLIRQYNVKQEWPVLLNDQKLGVLFLMEDPLTATLRVPGGLLKDGENTLSIIPPKENDDIVVSHFEWLDGSPAKAFAGRIEVKVTEANRPLPCRITVVDDQNSLAALHASETRTVAARPGVVYTANGAATIALRPGMHTIYASRGPEYSVATQRVAVAQGKVIPFEMRLTREVPTAGLVSSDTHIHTFTHAKHGDATIHERMLTIAGEGLELPISTEHNMLADFNGPAKAAGVREYFTPVLGCEVTTRRGHFNVFPILPESRVPDFRIEHWPALMENIRGTPGVQFVVLNHPRDVHSGFCPFAETNFNARTGENLRGFEFSFDGVELINSGALRTDLMQVFHDWFALLNYGHKIVGVGASDSHDVSRFIVGQGRTYILCDDSDPGRIDVAEVLANLKKGKALISLGLITKLKLEDRFEAGDLATGLGKNMKVFAQVLGPSWAEADQIELFANGKRIAQHRIDPSRRVEKANVSWTLPRPKNDFHLIAIASGPGVRSPHWAIPRPYQASSPKWNPRVLGATNPIWVDADGDGQYTPLRLQKAGD
jgi:hypothetical protein